jgi:uncharacterized protein DUF6941
MEKNMPLIAAAFVCERVLQEKGDVYSAIRIVDTYTTKIMAITPIPDSGTAPLVDGPQTPAGGQVLSTTPGQVLDMSALVMVRAGDLTGKHELTVEMCAPDGKTVKYPEPFRVEFGLGDPAEAAALTIRFVLAANSPAGRYWINVFWNGKPLTKIPVRLVKESESQGTDSGSQ